MKVLGTFAVALLFVTTMALGYAVFTKMDRTEAPTYYSDSGLATAPPSPPAAVPATAPPAIFIGDFTSGSNEGRGDKNWTSLLGEEIDKTRPLRILTDSTGAGSGYVVRGSSSIFPDLVRRLVTADAALVVIAGSRNDMVAAPQEVEAAAAETYRLVAEQAPNAALVVVGPSWVDDNPPPELVRTIDSVRTAATPAGATFVDPIADHWFTSGEPGLIGPDSVHPTDQGHRRIAEMMYPVIMNALNRTR